ncbi:NADH:flavin oxidoreductase/NADH oxidase [Flavobacterium sp. MC2016-06]|jgi:2,4-dienoyl-CoA reductase-like NADH-dependent reductase (Old Yellow Enzyme family)|uniref:NADH:flavin oxidoreductase/NADH oxidase n=1 Tax=Flavobacterium sp. MC2016-06 TaxID=2676308 RepID=UPI0012BAFA17|nr:NADH:flavin oxidoreductase/NADH oxidase [Flavobacterium sp. MC2016-06]MBU3861450.1 NADH:flavin oxidoreductase/NADH oxidase [Flavobacterium sp. MC2016-06]
MNLFTPITLRNLTLKNRIALSPMQQYSATNGIPNNWHLVHLGSRAVGGAGLILTECTAVAPEGLATLSDVGIWNDEQKKAWKNIVDFVHEQDAKIGIQLWHSGGKGSLKHPNERMKPLTLEEGGWIVKSSSPADFHGVIAQELTISEIQELKTNFVKATLRAIEAGFDTIELHAGHGYLFHQFYSAVINKRKDEYGGSFENRIRFLVETVQEIRNVIPEGMPLLARISAVDYIETEDAWILEDSIALSKILKENGVDFITASGGGFTNVSKDKVYSGYQVPFADAIKKQSGILTGAVGMITEVEQANAIISTEQADLVVIAREHLRDPYFAIHAAKELDFDIEIPWQYKRAF